MSSELEQRLTRVLSSQPGSSPAAERHARAAALASIPPVPRRIRPAAWLIVAAAGVAVIMTGVALAASPGSFRDLQGVVTPTPPPAKSHIPATRVPSGADGFTVQVGRRLWVSTPRGPALRGIPLAAAATSPQALYAVGEAAGRLEAVSITDRHVAWSVPLQGTLAAAAWSPYPIRVAYTVRRAGHADLHVIWGNGVNDQVVGPSAPLMPTWRWDSLAVAYIGARGAVLLDTIGAAAPQRINTAAACGAHRVTEVAFAPNSATLAEATDGPELILADTRHPGSVTCVHTGSAASGLLWLSPANLLYARRGSGELTRITTNHRLVTGRGTSTAPGAILGVAASPSGGSVAIAVRDGARLRILVADPPAIGASAALRPRQRLTIAPPAGRDVRIGWS